MILSALDAGRSATWLPPAVTAAISSARTTFTSAVTAGSNAMIRDMIAPSSASASKQKRQCQQTCDKDGKTCLTDCTTDPKETCFEICDKNGKCTQECSLIGQMEKRQCWKQCDENGENCGKACKTVSEKTCFEVCDKTGKCHSECSLIGEAEKREIELDD
jgi:hypothetical protein